MDFEDNPTAIVLMPEPYDYFSACSLTSLCAMKCRVEFEAFKSAISSYNPQPIVSTSEVAVEAAFFGDFNKDSYMPMKIVNVAELTQPSGDLCNTASRIVGVVGVVANNSISVKKYCIPTAKGTSTHLVDEWYVWHSEHWSSNVVDVQFTDVIYGDALLILRDGSGMPIEQQATYGPDEQFTSLHVRFAQLDGDLWTRLYYSANDRINRQILLQATSSFHEQPAWNPESILDIFTYPRGVDSIYSQVAVLREFRVDGNLQPKVVCAAFGVTAESDLYDLAEKNIEFTECPHMMVLFRYTPRPEICNIRSDVMTRDLSYWGLLL